MPRPRRDSATDADLRPAFNRPPGAPRRTSAARDDSRTPRRKHRDRNVDGDRSRDRNRDSPRDSPAGSPRVPIRKHGGHGAKRKVSAPVRDSYRPERDRVKYSSGTSTNSASGLLSAGSLAKLNAYNEKSEYLEQTVERKRKQKQYKNLKGPEPAQKKRRRKNRNVSGAILEEGRYEEKHTHTRKRDKGNGGNGKYYSSDGRLSFWRRRKWWILAALVIGLIIIIAAAVAVSKKNSSSTGSSGGGSSSPSSNGPQNTCSGSDVPTAAKGTYTDVTTWLDTTDFNCTYTNQTVGGLSVMGLMSTWDDSKRANPNVPALNQNWTYGQRPIRGVNLGGWLDLEPFITPSLFNYPSADGVVDEWTLSQKLGLTATRVLETHYASFITSQDFAAIAAAGLDHVRIPYPYWAVTTYDGDPYVPKVAWRYLLRGIEYARQNGLRVNLDLHSVPGSQNGWAHSGHQGSINWIIGTNGTLNAQRSLDIHNQLSQFFAQDRYKNVVTIYGLVNEPKMLVIPPASVIDWNTQAVKIIRANGIQQYLAFGDGFLSLTAWNHQFQNVDSKLLLDTHQYQIFDVNLLKLTHSAKIDLACTTWASILTTSNNPSTGWGPTMDGEWSQADTDCTQYLNNVGVGSRWAGTLNTGDPSTAVLSPVCASPPCSCALANADPSTYSASYKQFLKMYAEAQMHSFEQVWGWFYWTWKTESAPQWSWQAGLQAGILPQKAYAPDFTCSSPIPSFSDLSESY